MSEVNAGEILDNIGEILFDLQPELVELFD